jgi:aminopeptidase N
MVQSLARQAITALHLFSADDVREPGLRRFADYLLEQARAAAGGSDHQLALTRAFASIARTDEQVAVLSGLLAGGDDLAGLAVDTDLRWTLLQRLASRDRADDEAIDRELERDRTASGQRQAAAARAMRPTMEAKEAAWAATVSDDGLPNALLAATVGGFNQPDHAELHRAFVDRYFAMVAQVWSERTNDTAQTLVLGLYPAFIVEPETVSRTERFLADHDAPPALRRLLLESADGVSRSLRARTADEAGVSSLGGEKD